MARMQNIITAGQGHCKSLVPLTLLVLLLILLVHLSNGCATHKVQYGVKVFKYCEPKTIDYDEPLKILAEICSRRLGIECKIHLKKLRIQWCNFTCTLGFKRVSGYYSHENGYTVHIGWRGYFSRSAFAHEILHHIDYMQNKKITGSGVELVGIYREMETEINQIYSERGL